MEKAREIIKVEKENLQKEYEDLKKFSDEQAAAYSTSGTELRELFLSGKKNISASEIENILRVRFQLIETGIRNQIEGYKQKTTTTEHGVRSANTLTRIEQLEAVLAEVHPKFDEILTNLARVRERKRAKSVFMYQKNLKL